MLNELEENEIVHGVEQRFLGQAPGPAPFQVFDGVTLHKVDPALVDKVRVGQPVGMTTDDRVLVLENAPGFPVYGHIISVDAPNCEIQVKRV